MSLLTDDAKYRRLNWAIVLSTLVFSLAPLLALGWFIYNEFNRTFTDKVVGNLQVIVENKKKSIDLFLEEKIALVKIMALTNTYESIADPKRLGAMFQAIHLSSKSYVDLGVIGENGRHLAYAGPYDLKDVNYKDEPWFIQTMRKGFYVSDVFTGFRQSPHFIIAVLRRDGEKVWILRATIDLDVFNDLVRTLQVGKRGDAFLINKAAVLQTASRFSGPPLFDVDLPRQERFSGVKIDRTALGGRERIIGQAWLDAVDWVLVVSEEPNESFSPMFATQQTVFSMVFLGAVMIAAGAVLTSKSMIKRIQRADLEAARLDASLMHSSKMAALGKMAAGIAHEVNNPLTLIRESAGWIKDLLEDEDPKAVHSLDEIREVLGKIDLHVERARAVTHRMLGFGRRMEPVRRDVDLNALTEATLKFLENECLHRSIAVVKDFSPLPPIATDPDQLQQVILNVVDNAIDAVERNGRITLTTAKDEHKQTVSLTVEDSGPGMSQEALGKIFDPFFTTKAVGEGTGLGLSIVYGILEKLGGRIEARSAPGKGAAFIVTLPYTAEQS